MPGKKPKIITTTIEEIKKLTDEYIVPAVKSEVDRNEIRLRNIESLLGISGEQNYYMLTEEQKIDLLRKRLKNILEG